MCDLLDVDVKLCGVLLTHARIKDAQGKYDILFTDLDTQPMSFVVAAESES